MPISIGESRIGCEWQHAAKWMLAAATDNVLEPVMKQFGTILFIQGKLMFKG